MKLRKLFFVFVAALLASALVLSCASSGGGGKSGGGGARGPEGRWTFENPDAETGGWELASDEFYQYKGAASLSRDDTTFGRGMLRLDVDFTAAKDFEWSEPKLKNDFPRAFNMKGITKFAFDFYYNPSLASGGNFKSKIFSNSNGLRVDFTGNDILDGEDAGNGFLKAPVEILIMPTAGFMTDMRLSIAGYLTDYKGPVFFDNMRWE